MRKLKSPLVPGGSADAREQFREYAVGAQPHLRRSAYLLCGDWHTAEDLVQTTFGRLFRSWPRVSRADSVDAYARTVLYRAFLDLKQKDRTTVALDDIPEPASPADDAALRLAVRSALDTLPPRARAVVLLRFWEDLTVEQTADALGVSSGTVKSQTSRAIAILRQRLGAAVGELIHD
ncbi:RNA polymerase sigma-70 factor (sigma-E family) [Catenulispora sp. GP43]|uniref:SigE family RNA polymerase sigma factor n=1 Tax=Catenulispora sp. GP43 TaxID=3156263 RepID=UPI003517A4A5